MSKTIPVAASKPVALVRWAQQWIVVPRRTLAARLTLVALALALQNLLELPRELFSNILGATLTGILVFLALATSIILLLAAIGKAPPRWRWPYRRAPQIVALCLTLVVVPLGARADREDCWRQLLRPAILERWHHARSLRRPATDRGA